MDIKPVKVPYQITSFFGFRKHPITKKKDFHNGIDIPLPIGTELIAEEEGIVVLSKANKGNPNTGFGYYMVIEYNGYCILYAHLMKLGLPVGTKVKCNDVVGFSGNSGSSTGPHLHLEVRKGKYNWLFFRKNLQGKYFNSVDPQTFEKPADWKQRIIKKMDYPESWIRVVEELIEEGIREDNIKKFFGEFIMKL